MAETSTIRRGGPLRHVLRFFVIGYLFVLVVWPLSVVVDRTFRPTDGAEGGVAAFLERLQDPSVTYAFQLTLTAAFWAVVINTVFGVGISLLLHGFTRLALAIVGRKEIHRWGWLALAGAVNIVVGIIALAWPGVTIAVLSLVLGFQIIVFGAVLLAVAFIGSRSPI